jgi:hypothetical protein
VKSAQGEIKKTTPVLSDELDVICPACVPCLMSKNSGEVNKAPDSSDELNVIAVTRTDPHTGLPLPDPYLDYITCPHCGEQEIEVFCYQTEVVCHNCGKSIAHIPPSFCGTYPFCKRGTLEKKKTE